MTVLSTDRGGTGEHQSLKRRILVVDDNRAITSLLTTALKRQGYETAAAYSGEEAIQVASSFRPDFIVSDVIMGGMNGVDAVLKILQTLPKCKVLFISGAGYIEPLHQARSRGFDFELLLKPVPMLELLRRISQILAA
jgi:two-component system OmpR family response regulator